MLRACTLNLYVVKMTLVMDYKLRIPGKPKLVTLVSKGRWKRWLFRNSSVRLVYAIDEDVTRSLVSPQMRCVVQVRIVWEISL